MKRERERERVVVVIHSLLFVTSGNNLVYYYTKVNNL
jgi:hypothetical protein